MLHRLAITAIGNLIDTIATVYLHRHGYTEANPVMALLLPRPWLFATVKIVAMTAVLWWLWRGVGESIRSYRIVGGFHRLRSCFPILAVFFYIHSLRRKNI